MKWSLRCDVVLSASCAPQPTCVYGIQDVRNQRGFRNGNTLGRIVQVGFAKEF